MGDILYALLLSMACCFKFLIDSEIVIDRSSDWAV